MNISQAAALCLEYHKSNSRQTTIRGYEAILSKFCRQFADNDLDLLLRQCLNLKIHYTTGGESI